MPAPLELLHTGGDGGAIAAALSGRFTVEADAAVTDERSFLDSFDARLRAAGLVLERRGAELRLREPGRADRVTQAASPASGAVRAAELAPGPARERLAEVLGVRAALPRARVRSERRRLRVLNSDAKTVVRVEVDAPTVLAGARVVALEPRVLLSPVLGYEKAFARVRDALDLPLAPSSLVDAAVAASGGDPRGTSTKLDLDLDAGQRSDAALLAVCLRLAAIVDATLPGTLEDHDPEFLHDLRVAVRRTRSMLRELAGVLPAAEERRARAELGWVQEVTGPTRDLDVQLEEWGGLLARLPGTTARDLAPLRALLAQERERAFARMRLHLRGARFEAAFNDWRALLDRPLAAEPDGDRPNAARPIGELAGRRIRKVYRRMVRLGREIDAGSPAEDLHRLRKRGKELRYLLETFGGLWPRDEVKPMVAALKRLQDVLGRFQDREVQAEALRALGPGAVDRPGGADALIALGRLLDQLADEQQQARAEFSDCFAAFASKPNRKRVEKVFR